MKVYLINMVVVLLLFSSFNRKESKKIIVAIFAHPDDELSIAPVLVKFAKENKVYVIIATDGKGGTRLTGIEGDSLGKVRQAESICSFQKLGIEPPIFLHVDRLDSKFTLKPFFEQTKAAKDSLKNIIERLRPDVIITFGPDGDTGHPEHRVIGALATELILREGWAERYRLYYLLWTKKQVTDRSNAIRLMYTDNKYINIAIKYTDDDEAKTFEAMSCYKSQMTSKEMEEAMKAEKADTSNTLYFRKFAVDTTKTTSFW